MKYQDECSGLLALLDERDPPWAVAVSSAVERSVEQLKKILANLRDAHADADVREAAQEALDEVVEQESENG